MAPQKLGKWMVNPAYFFLFSNISHDGLLNMKYSDLRLQNTTGNNIPYSIIPSISQLTLAHPPQQCFNVSEGLILLPLRFQVLRLPLSQPFRPGLLRS